jgi:hypothetical protein
VDFYTSCLRTNIIRQDGISLCCHLRASRHMMGKQARVKEEEEQNVQTFAGF